jgi:hypothetical protein
MMAVNTPYGPWTAIDPAEWIRTWQAAWRLTPDNLVQPILPGWTFNLNSTNSTAPETEVAVLAKHSYGRQIGRMSDALELLIEERHGKNPKDEPFSDFLAMKREIDQIKQDAAVTRIEQIIKDLALLKEQDAENYARLRDALREALG